MASPICVASVTIAEVAVSHAMVASVSDSVLAGIVPIVGYTNGRVSGLIKTGIVRGGRVVGLCVGATVTQPLSDGRQTGSDSGQLVKISFRVGAQTPRI